MDRDAIQAMLSNLLEEAKRDRETDPVMLLAQRLAPLLDDPGQMDRETVLAHVAPEDRAAANEWFDAEQARRAAERALGPAGPEQESGREPERER